MEELVIRFEGAKAAKASTEFREWLLGPCGLTSFGLLSTCGDVPLGIDTIDIICTPDVVAISAK